MYYDSVWRRMESGEEKSTSPVGGGGVRLGRVAGVEIKADWSLLLAFVLIAVTFGADAVPTQHLRWSTLRVWVVAILAAVLFVVAILAHEIGHMMVARRFGCGPWRSRLFVLCGVTELHEPPRTPAREFGVMMAGPLVSFALGLMSSLLGVALVGEALYLTENPLVTLRGLRTLETLLLWFGPVNLMVGLLNLFPGYPFDGGRLLRAILWSITGDKPRATALAVHTGRVLGLLIMLTGLAMILGLRVPYLGGGFVLGLATVFIGLFLNRAPAFRDLGPSD